MKEPNRTKPKNKCVREQTKMCKWTQKIELNGIPYKSEKIRMQRIELKSYGTQSLKRVEKK